MTVAIMFQTGGHAQCLWTAKRRHDISLLCLGSRPNPNPAAASPVCLGFQASYRYSEDRRPGWIGQAGAGLRRPPPLLSAMYP